MVREALRGALTYAGQDPLRRHDLEFTMGERYEALLVYLSEQVADAIDAHPLPTLTTSQLLTVHSALDLAAVYTRLVIARSKEDLPGHEDLLAEQDALVELFDRELAEAEERELQTGSTAGVEDEIEAPAPNPDISEGSGRSVW